MSVVAAEIGWFSPFSTFEVVNTFKILHFILTKMNEIRVSSHCHFQYSFGVHRALEWYNLLIWLVMPACKKSVAHVNRNVAVEQCRVPFIKTASWKHLFEHIKDDFNASNTGLQPVRTKAGEHNGLTSVSAFTQAAGISESVCGPLCIISYLHALWPPNRW